MDGSQAGGGSPSGQGTPPEPPRHDPWWLRLSTELGRAASVLLPFVPRAASLDDAANLNVGLGRLRRFPLLRGTVVYLVVTAFAIVSASLLSAHDEKLPAALESYMLTDCQSNLDAYRGGHTRSGGVLYPFGAYGEIADGECRWTVANTNLKGPFRARLRALGHAAGDRGVRVVRFESEVDASQEVLPLLLRLTEDRVDRTTAADGAIDAAEPLTPAEDRALSELADVVDAGEGSATPDGCETIRDRDGLFADPRAERAAACLRRGPYLAAATVDPDSNTVIAIWVSTTKASAAGATEAQLRQAVIDWAHGAPYGQQERS